MDEILQFTQMFNIDKKELGKKVPYWRFDTLNVRGVDKMTSEDVYDYFGEIHPHTVEWLSNISCNVSFDTVSTAINALIAVGRALVISKKNSQDAVLCEEDTLGLEVKSSDSLEIPVPPNYRYILGCPSDKAKAIILRFATINDIKSGDFAPKSRAQKMDVDEAPIPKPIRNPTQIDNPLMFSNNIVLKMRADEEVEKLIYKKNALKKERDPKNVWERLGKLPVSRRIAAPAVRSSTLSGSTSHRRQKSNGSSVFDRLSNLPRADRDSRNRSQNVWNRRDDMNRRQNSYSVPSRVESGRVQKSSHIWASENRKNIESRLSKIDRNLVVYNEDEQNF